MRSLRRVISRLILFVILATVLSPGFGWELVSAEMHHDHAAVVGDFDQVVHDHDNHVDHDGDHALADHDAPRHADHGHAGHILGHMPATVGLLDPPCLVLAGPDWTTAEVRVSLPEFPRHLLRPPNTRLVA